MQSKTMAKVLKMFGDTWPNVNITSSMIETWYEANKDLDDDLALETALNVIRTREFFPSMAYWRDGVLSRMNHRLMEQRAREHEANLQQWEQEAAENRREVEGMLQSMADNMRLPVE